ncbi:hypothetical protein ACVGOW_08080 [Pseudonocardia saturnea]
MLPPPPVLLAAVAALRTAAVTPAAPGLRDRLWWATGSAAGAAAARGTGVLAGRPGMAADLARSWARAVGEPRVAAVRIVAPGEAPGALLDRRRDDPVREWATELVVSTQPADAPVAVHVATMRALTADARGTAMGLADSLGRALGSRGRVPDRLPSA